MCRRFVGRMSELLKRMPPRLRGVLEGGVGVAVTSPTGAIPARAASTHVCCRAIEATPASGRVEVITCRQGNDDRDGQSRGGDRSRLGSPPRLLGAILARIGHLALWRQNFTGARNPRLLYSGWLGSAAT